MDKETNYKVRPHTSRSDSNHIGRYFTTRPVKNLEQSLFTTKFIYDRVKKLRALVISPSGESCARRMG